MIFKKNSRLLGDHSFCTGMSDFYEPMFGSHLLDEEHPRDSFFSLYGNVYGYEDCSENVDAVMDWRASKHMQPPLEQCPPGYNPVLFYDMPDCVRYVGEEGDPDLPPLPFPLLHLEKDV